MKSILSLSFLLLIAALSFANESEIHVKSDIKEVTVFLSGASLTSQGTFNSGSGNQEIVFENLSPFIDANSIQAKGEGNYTILSVTFRTNYLNNQVKPKEIKTLEDSLEQLQFKTEAQKNLRTVYENEEAFLLSNKNIGGANTGVSGLELEKIANLLRTRLPELKIKEQECRIKEKKLQEETARIQGQLNELNSKRAKNTGEVVVDILSKSPGNSKMSISYHVANAGWSPIYDLRAPGNNGPVKLDYRANIIQNTGVEWNNVKLTLSTGNPNQSGTQPILNPLWLNFYAPVTRNSYKGAYDMAPAAMKSEVLSLSGDKRVEEKENDQTIVNAETVSQYIEVNESQTNISYEISIPYTIASDNKEHSVEIQSFSIPADYHYYAAPKLDPDAFLLANITGWDQYNLLSGNMNIFFEDNFVGKSYLNTLTTSDTLALSLGRDKNVVIKRTIIKDFSKEALVGSNKKETRSYEISARNKKKQDIEIEIVDQIPLSKNNDIAVDLLEFSKARYDKETGKLTWKLKLASGEEKKMKMGYSVKYPANRSIPNI